MTDVVTFGEAMAALRGDGPLRLGATMQLSVAGAETNVAIGLARLGHSVRWIGRIGEDELGELVRRTLRAEAIDTTAIVADGHRATGLALFERRIGALVRVAYYRDGSAGSMLAASDVLPWLDGAKLLHVTGISAALSPQTADAVEQAVHQARALGVLISFDVNYRSRLWTPAAAGERLRPLALSSDVVFASEDELALIAAVPGSDTAAIVAELLGHGVGEVVVKRGPHGAQAHTRDGITTASARGVQVVDVVGAGDAFVAGYLSARLDGLDVAGRLDRGVTTGAFAVARHGDWEGAPTRAELALLDGAAETTIR